MKTGNLVRWNRDGYEQYLSLNTAVLPWFEKRGIVLEVDGERIKPAVVTVMWDPGSFEKIFADDLEVINESR